MATLLLMRHAKALQPGSGQPGSGQHGSGQPEFGQPDVDRSLSPRGREDALAAAAVLQEQVHSGSVTVLVSTARRTTETYEAVASALPAHEHIAESRLYEAAVSTVVDLLASQQAECCLVIGHNPTMRDLLEHLTDAQIESFPTSAIAVLEGEWSNLASGQWRLISFSIPRAC